MDKNTYETYEYLPTNNGETDSDQYFVVQDDGTFLINRQVQYVAEVEDVKGVLESVQPCTVYDVTPQQFFVDVDNSTELISVSDQFVLPEGENNLYANSYLLQPVSSEAADPLEESVLDSNLKQTSSNMDEEAINNLNKQTTSCTEITLSDEQYQMLEQKGWILLETNEKIFILDTLGLHDITNNDKLIQKLKGDVQSNANLEINSGPVKIENVSSTPENVTHNISGQQDTIEFIFGNDVIAKNKEQMQENLSFPANEKDVKETIRESLLNEKDIVSFSQDKPIFKELKKYKYGERIQLKTSLIFKDVPDKINLGKNCNGKKIVAKVTKSKCGKIRHSNVNQNQNKFLSNIKLEKANNMKVIAAKNTKPIQLTNINLQETQFENLIQLLLYETPEIKHNVEDIEMADAIISQLLRVPAFKPSIIERNLVITKVLQKEDEFGKICSERPILVTGRVTSIDGDNWRFVHHPSMLQTLMNENSELSGENPTENIAKDDSLLHVHISETKHSDNIVRTSVTLNKRQIPKKFIPDIRKRNLSMMYACGACAAIFQSENDLKEHQEIHNLESDDVLTIDTDKINKTSGIYCVIEYGKEKVYSCMHCEHKFTRLSNCHRHVKTHLNPTKQEISDNDKDSSNVQSDPQKHREGMYKCKMCSSSYYHPSTLSKHIVTRHIKVT